LSIFSHLGRGIWYGFWPSSELFALDLNLFVQAIFISIIMDWLEIEIDVLVLSLQVMLNLLDC
jgi:hypothetical protein